MATSSLLIGSYLSMPDQTLTFGGGAEEVQASLTSIYVDHATAALSLITQVGNAIANQETGGAAVLLQNGKVKLSATSTFSLTWTDTIARDILGFTGDLTGANSYTAPGISPYIWLPGTTETPGRAVIGLTGSNDYDAVRVQAPDGTQVTRIFGSRLQRNTLSWRYIPKIYHQTTDLTGGELSVFFDNVLVKGAKFNHHRAVTFDTSSSSAMTIGAALGPYEMESDARGLGDQFKRSAGLETVEASYDFGMNVLVTPEYT